MNLSSFAFRLFLFPGVLCVLCRASFPAQKQPACKRPAELEKAIATQPSVGALNALGSYFAQHQQLSCAIAAFEKALKLDPRSWETRYNLSLSLVQKGNKRRAVQELREVVSQKPDLLNARNAMASALHDVGDLEGAEAEYKAALALDPRSVYALHNLGELLMTQKRFAAAIGYLKQAVEIDAAAYDHPLSLAIAYSQNNEVEAAINLLQKLLLSHPQPALVHFNLGTVYANQRRFQEAADAYRQALKLDSKNDLTRVSFVKALVSLNQFEEALPEILDYARRHPGDFDTRYLKGVALRGAGRYGEAEVELRQAVSLNPDHFDAAYNFAFVLARLRKLTEARIHLERAKQLNPDSADARYQLASVLRGLKEPELAKREFEEFERRKNQGLQENIAGSTGSKANQLLEQGDPQSAAQLYREALKLDPNNARTLYNLALALNKSGDTEGEKKALEEALRLDPKMGLAHNQLGLLLLSSANISQAEKEFQAALTIDPQFAEAQNNLGTLYGQQGNNKAAEKLFRRAVENSPQYAQAYLNLGLTLAAEDRLSEGKKEIQAALQLTPEHVGALTALGMVQARLGELQESVRSFRKVIELTPQSAEAHLNLGIALADAYDLEEALKEFSGAIRLAPKAAAGYYNKGRVLHDLHRFEEAQPVLETACRLAPDYAPSLFTLAIIERQLDHNARAVELLQRVVTIDPKDANAQFQLGQNLSKLGRTDEAVAHWERVVEMNPEHGEALYNLSRLLGKEDPKKAQQYQERFLAFQKRRQITDRAETLGNFALASASAKDWLQAVAQLQEAIEVCGQCRSLGDLHKNLGLIYCRSGDLKNGEEQLRLALQLKPEDPDALKSLEILKTLESHPAP